MGDQVIVDFDVDVSTLTSSKEKLRIGYLNGLSSKVQTLDKKDVGKVVQGLLLTYSRYLDRKSIDAVKNFWTASYESHPELLESALTKLVTQESSKVLKLSKDDPDYFTSTAFSRYGLLVWSIHFFKLFWKRSHKPSTNNEVILKAIFKLLDSLVNPKIVNEGLIRASLREMRSIFSLGSGIFSYASDLAVKNLVSYHDFPIIHVLHKFQSFNCDEANKILDSYINIIINSKTPVPIYVNRLLGKFLKEYVTLDIYNSKLKPSIDKMLLRSPEVIIQTIIPLLESVNFDLSGILSSKLADQIFPLYQSTSPKIRQDSFDLFALVCRKANNSEEMKKVCDKLIKAMSAKIASWEHRSAYYKSCDSLVQSESIKDTSPILVKSLLQLIPKEANENAFQILMDTFSLVFIYYINNNTVDEEHIKTTAALFEKGFKSDKPGLRRGYFKALGKIILESKEVPAKFFDCSIGPLSLLLAKFQTTPAASTSIPLEGYVALTVLELARKNGRYDEALSKNGYNMLAISGPKSKDVGSILTIEKVLSKLNQKDDFEWFFNLFEVISKDYSYFSLSLRKALSRSWIRIVLDITSKQDAKRCFVLSNKFSSISPSGFAELIVFELSELLKSGNLFTKFQYSNIRKLLLSLFATENLEENKQLLVKALILANYELLKPTDGSFLWITLVSKAKLNVEELVKLNSTAIFEAISNSLSSENFERWNEAIFNTVKLATFINPFSLGEQFVKKILTLLDQPRLSSITSEEIEIWKTPEGSLYKDVLKKDKNIAEDKNKKNYEDEKWEREVRESIAKRQGQMKETKLSKEQSELVNKQLAHESTIREAIKDLAYNLESGFLFTENLIVGLTISGYIQDLPKSFESLLSDLIPALFNVLKNKYSKLLLNGKGPSVWYTLRSICPSEMNEIPELICYATLRSYDIKVSPEWEGEPLFELISRLLFRLQMFTSRSKLPASALTYTLPLLSKIIFSSGIGFDKTIASDKVKDVGHDDDQPTLQMEQLHLALEILGNHCNLGSDDSFPHREVLSCLLFAIESQPKLVDKAFESLLELGNAMSLSTCLTYESIMPLIDALLSESQEVRKSSLQALEPIDLLKFNPWANIWIEQYDFEDKTTDLSKRESTLATILWKINKFEVPRDFENVMYSFLDHEVAHVRNSAANSFSALSELYPDSLPSVLKALYSMYAIQSKPITPEYDRFGILIQSSLHKTDPYLKRVALGIALGKVAPHLDKDLIEGFFNFMLYSEALGDKNEEVRKVMLNSCLNLIEAHGLDQMNLIMPIFKNYLDQPDKKTEKHDFIREGVVILYGTLAQNLGKKTEVSEAISKLIQTLNTPSESVQYAVANCLAPLVRIQKEGTAVLVKDLLDKCLNADRYAKRRGAAYGLAGVVKGHGIIGLKEFDIMSTLSEAASSKKIEHKQGAMFAFETLCDILGRLFEPYLIQILPHLLACFSDSSDDVRRATLSTSRVIMSKLSEYGVKLMLPSLLNGLDDYQWRTKRGAIELLGSMAFCAPKQLSISLPTIVPRLILVLNDSHHQVKLSADNALNSFTNVINNPEIRELMPKIMEALSDPDKNTPMVLKSLLETPFIHYLDSPCLALIIPILQRGLKERSTDVKCKASQIVGNMASLTEQDDLIPYLPELIPYLKSLLGDPVPEARGTSAKSLGIMVAKLGEINFPNVIEELLDTLNSESSSVDRSGSAQALSEILAGLDITRLEGLLPEVISKTKSPKPNVRESYVTLLIYLPATFGVRFKPYLQDVLPSVINGLADESEYVRDASLRASQIIITNYSDRAVDLLLPELLKGVFEPNWRIRQASAQLMGDLLFKLMGIAAKVEVDEDAANNEDNDEDNETAVTSDNSRKALVEALGKERRDMVLSSLYVIRFDTSAKVRQVASAIWLMIVANTPRTLKEVLPLLLEYILAHINSIHADLEHMFTSALCDVVKKLGENGLKVIMPIINSKLEYNQFEVRQSACKALSEMISVLGRSDSGEFINITMNAVLKALCDESPEVRESATQTFATLHTYVGQSAVDFFLDSLLKDLTSNGNLSALEALRCLVSVRSDAVLPQAIEELSVAPISHFNADALTALISEGGHSLNEDLRPVLIPILESMNQEDKQNIEALQRALDALMTKVDNEGVEILMEVLSEWIAADEEWKKIQACNLMSTFFNVNKQNVDIQAHIVGWIRILVPYYAQPNGPLQLAAAQAFTGLVKSIDKSELDQLVIPLRQIVANARKLVGMDKNLPGFCLPKAISPFLTIYLQGLMYSTADIRERSSAAIGDLLDCTSADVLKPFVTQITGPLIRVIAERYSSVRASILDTLYKMLIKIGPLLKPFLPQLQRTFIKNLGDIHSEAVREKAAKALDLLIGLLLRVDPLVTELVNGCKQSEDDSILLNYIGALKTVTEKVGDKLSTTSKESIAAYLNENIDTMKGSLKTKAQEILALL